MQRDLQEKFTRFLGATVSSDKNLIASLNLLPGNSKILDIGSGTRQIDSTIITFDLVPLPGVDIVGDIHQLPIQKDSIDGVISTGTLEHVKDPWKAVKEFYRILKPGGIVYIEVPFIQGYHADPTDFWRFTIDGLTLLCKDFEKLDIGVHIGPTSSLVWVSREWANCLSQNRYVSGMLYLAATIITTPLKYLDCYLMQNPKSHRVCSALWFRGKKKIAEPVAHTL